MKRVLAVLTVVGFVFSGYAASSVIQKIGSISSNDISKIDRLTPRVLYTAEFKTKNGNNEKTEGVIRCWKDQSGRIGCTESGVVFTRGSATSYERQIADSNFANLEALYNKNANK